MTRRRAGKLALSRGTLPGGGGTCACVSGRESVVLSSNFLSVLLISRKVSAMRVTVNSGLLVCP